MTSTVSSLRLPPVLREIADVSNVAAALKLAQAKGGTRIYVPRKISEGHWLAELLGMEAANAVRKLYGGENIDVPLGLSGALQSARRTARQALDDGASVSQAARAAGLTERTIYNLMSRDERVRASGQRDLFEE
ncbi:Mor transcription activator family protein [Methylobacterium iners]|uniref:Mor transcription activator domain-containing protein n=1 Tax=Methylobacterium iners TaxID=418707 RepID=A0ABQ4S7J7_9HYPH|nr:Mor transcription activator family protein [Methylobacterium iners]GJD97737.1 hypothetical protein OCOJLMKI_4970 [Methylobacterium iners]